MKEDLPALPPQPDELADATAQFLIELAFLVPRGTSLHPEDSKFGKTISRFANAVRADERKRVAASALPPRCNAEMCVCGHFQCKHDGALFRGVYTCDECECLGFTPSAVASRPQEPT